MFVGLGGDIVSAHLEDKPEVADREKVVASSG